jgi:hypothetical protein
MVLSVGGRAYSGDAAVGPAVRGAHTRTAATPPSDWLSMARVLTQNLHLAPSTQQAEQAGFTREEITRRASQFSLKINKRQSS